MNARSSILMLVGAGILAAAISGWLPSLRPPASNASAPAPAPTPVTDPSAGRISPELAAQLLALESREQEAAETVWAVESLAATCGAVFESFWDRLNASTSRWDLVTRFPAREFLLPVAAPPQPGPHAIQRHQPTGRASALTPAAWNRHTAQWRDQGWSIVQTEFRHTRFETNTAGHPARSRFAFSAHLVRSDPAERATLEGPLEITWAEPGGASAEPRIERLDASQLEWRTRPGQAPFVPRLAEPIVPSRLALSIDPLIAQDLDQDGFPEFLLIGRNLVFRREADGAFRSEPISPALNAVVSTAVLGDFNGDAHPDLLCQGLRALELLPGLPGGRFATGFQTAWTSPPELRSAMVLTAGDINHDGDLDVFLGQYKEPYEGGSSPTPFQSANDGYPAFLLLNDGSGRFTDVTPASGLAPKRHRRIYSASFADLDVDGAPDLLTVSDFAGLDLHRNDGLGRFTDVTRAWVSNPHAFGMAHALADFNADGRLDLLMIGMSSPTVDRLEHLGLRRPDSRQDPSQRLAMTHGNRLYLAQPGGGYAETPFGDSIARSGWSWGCAAADFDNDGFPDVAIGNGLESRESVRDYEAEYWLHDQHVGTSEENPAAYLYFKSKIARTRGRGMSYGGYEKNRLYLNRNADHFLEAGHLLGVALEQDSRNVLAEDVDADGRVDLIVTSFGTWPDPKPILRIYLNTLPDVGHWIGFRMPGAPPGTRVSIVSPAGPQVRQIVTGDSHRAQHSTTLHFGLGRPTGPIHATVAWPNGKTIHYPDLPADRYHQIPVPDAGPVSGME